MSMHDEDLIYQIYKHQHFDDQMTFEEFKRRMEIITEDFNNVDESYIIENKELELFQHMEDAKALADKIKNHPGDIHVKWGDSLREQYEEIQKLIPYDFDIVKMKDYLEEAKKFLKKAHDEDNDTCRLLDIMYAEDFIECALTELEEE